MKSLISFQGTINRSQYWLGVLVASLVSILCSLPISWLPVGMMLDSYFFILLLLILGLFWVMFALCAKRLRDAGLSPWVCLLLFVPLVSLVVFLVIGFKPTAAERTAASR